MLHMALVFLVIGLVAALLGFTTIAGASFAIAKFLVTWFIIQIYPSIFLCKGFILIQVRIMDAYTFCFCMGFNRARFSFSTSLFGNN